MTPDVALSAQPMAPAPIMKPDMRPTADAAAIARDPQPTIPMPVPASNGQNAAVTQSKVSSETVEAVDAADPTQRVLKPYGVAMLPDQHKQERESQQDADARAEEVARSAAEAKQNDKVEAAEQQAFAAKAEEAQVNARAVVEPMEPKEAPPRPQASNAIPPEEGPQKQESRAEPPKQSPKPET